MATAIGAGKNRCLPKNLSSLEKFFSLLEKLFPNLEKIFSGFGNLLSRLGISFSRVGFLLPKHLCAFMSVPCGAAGRGVP